MATFCNHFHNRWHSVLHKSWPAVIAVAIALAVATALSGSPLLAQDPEGSNQIARPKKRPEENKVAKKGRSQINNIKKNKKYLPPIIQKPVKKKSITPSAHPPKKLSATAESSFQLRGVFRVEKDQSNNEFNQKNEIRSVSKLNLAYGDINLFVKPDLKATTDAFRKESAESAQGYRYAPKYEKGPNLRVSAPNYEVMANELYLGIAFEKLRIRAGNQIYSWGTSDVFGLTSYFNPTDYREFILKPSDESKLGVPALSTLFYGDGYTIELVGVARHVPALLPLPGSYWALQVDNFTLPIAIDRETALEPEQRTISSGLRLATTAYGIDTALSFFKGIDKDPLLLPYGSTVTSGDPLTINVKPVYSRVDYAGLDFSKNLGKFVLHGESVYSPNKMGLLASNVANIDDLDFPFSYKQSPYRAYTVGFNYFIPLSEIFKSHGSETVFSAEFTSSDYVKKEMQKPVLTDIAALRLQDTFFDSKLSLSVTGLIDAKLKGNMVWPEMAYRFDSGLSFNLAATQINGKSQVHNSMASPFYYYRQHKVVLATLKYDF